MIGIDYSYSSPAICINNADGLFFYYMNAKKKRIVRRDDVKLYGTILPDFEEDIAKFEYISSWADDVIAMFPKEDIQIEGYAMGAMGRVFQIGENTGMLKLKIFNAGRKFVVIPPTQIKKHATGKGNAKKDGMAEAFAKIHPELDFRKLTSQPPGAESPSSDLIDAYFIATCPVLAQQTS